MTIAIDFNKKEITFSTPMSIKQIMSKFPSVDITDFKICPVEVTATIEAQPFKYTMTSTSD